MTMPQLDQLSVCPSCAEPLEEGDRFCGACGTDLEAALRGPAPGAAPAAPQGPAGSPGAAGSQGPEGPMGFGALGGVPGAVPNGVPPRPEALPVTPALGQPSPGAPGAVVPTPTEPDFTLPPALRLPAQAPGGAPVTHEHPDASREATGPPPPGAAPVRPGTDPRTSDPRTVLDEAPAYEAPEYTAPAYGSATYGTAAYEAPGRSGSVGGVTSGPETLGPRCVACGTGTIDNDGYCEHCGHKQPRERDHMESVLGSVAAASDRGLRHHRNEDFFTVSETATPEGSPVTIAVVCDGVSSATRPDEASEAAAEAACGSLRESVPRGVHPQQSMHDALIAAAEAVNVLGGEGPSDPAKNAPACTIVGALTADGILTVGWIGDSRAYWVPEDRTAPSARLTEDDSWAAQMVAAGLMSEAEAYADSRAHAITGWLGADAYEIDPHTASFKPDRPGVVVVCTDGLWNYAESAEEMAAAVPHDALTRPLHSAQHLVGYALDGGGHDNVTVAVVPFPAPPGGAGPA